MTAVQKIIKCFAIALAAVIIAGIVGGVARLAYEFTSFSENEVKPSSTDKKSYSFSDNIRSLSISTGSADIEIKSGDAFGVEADDDVKVSYFESTEKLFITTKKVFFGSLARKRKIALTVPEAAEFEEIEIDTGAGALTAQGLSCRRLYIDIGSGTAELKDLIARENAEIDGGAGKLTVDGGSLCNLDLDVGVGETKVKSRLFGECEIDHGVGRLELMLLGTALDYRISADNGLGEFTVDGKKMADGDTFGSGECSIEIDGGVGEIKVGFAE